MIMKIENGILIFNLCIAATTFIIIIIIKEKRREEKGRSIVILQYILYSTVYKYTHTQYRIIFYNVNISN